MMTTPVPALEACFITQFLSEGGVKKMILYSSTQLLNTTLNKSKNKIHRTLIIAWRQQSAGWDTNENNTIENDRQQS